MRHIINSRTKGILETMDHPFPRPPLVRFFHRTMYDFLRTKDMKEFLASKLSNDFNIHIWLMKGCLIKAKRYPVLIYNINSGFLELRSGLAQELFRMLGHALDALSTLKKAAKKEHFRAVFALLDEYERTLHHHSLQALASQPSCKMLLVAEEDGRRAYTSLVSYFREVVLFHACGCLLSEHVESKNQGHP